MARAGASRSTSPSTAEGDVRHDRAGAATDGLPSFATQDRRRRASAPSRSRRGARRDTADSLRIATPGKPGEHQRHRRPGRRRATAPSSVVDLEIKVKVPLVGGKLEDLHRRASSRHGLDIEHERRRGVAGRDADMTKTRLPRSSTTTLDAVVSRRRRGAMLGDPEFREEVATCAARVLRRLVAASTPDGDGDATVVGSTRCRPPTGIPSFATKFVGDEIAIVQTRDAGPSADRRPTSRVDDPAASPAR